MQVATRDFKPGDVVVKEPPYAYAVSEDEAERVCNVEMREISLEQTSLCSGCRFVRCCFSLLCHRISARSDRKDACTARMQRLIWLSIFAVPSGVLRCQFCPFLEAVCCWCHGLSVCYIQENISSPKSLLLLHTAFWSFVGVEATAIAHSPPTLQVLQPRSTEVGLGCRSQVRMQSTSGMQVKKYFVSPPSPASSRYKCPAPVPTFCIATVVNCTRSAVGPPMGTAGRACVPSGVSCSGS